jgi:DNA end-binding protein Ku
VAPRAYWKGYLKLSLVSCPVALFPASSEREKISFNQINKKTGNRIRYRKVDAETGDEVDSAEIIKGYEVGKGQYIEIEPEELEAIAIESKRAIEIDEFVPKKEIDELYLNSPYYLAPDGEVGQQAFAVIREAIRKEGMVALGRVVFTSREHVIALEPRGKGLLGITLRYKPAFDQPQHRPPSWRRFRWMLVTQNSKRHPEFIEQGVRIDLCGCDTLTSFAGGYQCGSFRIVCV